MQTVWKFFLSEGEKMVLMTTRRLHDQGAFGLVSNLGSRAFIIFYCAKNQSLPRNSLGRKCLLLDLLTSCLNMEHTGSLAARFIFQPIEETSNTLFTKLTQTSSNATATLSKDQYDTIYALLGLLIKLNVLVGQFAQCTNNYFCMVYQRKELVIHESMFSSWPNIIPCTRQA
jgi:hypothetical protein